MADKQAKELLLTKFNLCNVLLLIPPRGTILILCLDEILLNLRIPK